MQPKIKENIWKNLILIILLVLVYFPINNFLINSSSTIESALAGDILLVASIIAVIACFGNFAFTYEKVASEKFSHRMLGHFTTSLLMLIIGISLIFISILITSMMGRFIIMDATLLLLYVACVSYDFWDLLRN